MQSAPKAPIASLRRHFSNVGIVSNFGYQNVEKTSLRPIAPSNPRRAMDRYSCSLLKKTHFCRDEIAVLIHIFYKLCRGKFVLKTDDLKNFLNATFRITDLTTLDAYVRAIDNERLGYINANKFVKAMNILLRGSLKEKAGFVFRMLDADQDGFVQRNVEMVSYMTNMYKMEIIAAVNPGADPNEPDRDTVDYVMKKLDPILKEKCTKNTFVSAIEDHPLLMECCFPVWPDDKYIIAFQRLLLIPVQESSILLYN